MPVTVERLLSDFLELVRIPAPSGKEAEVARAVIAKLSELGYESQTDKAGEGFGGEQGNVIVKVAGALDVPPLMLNAHLDTVTPCECVKPRIEDGVVRSDGTTVLGGDNKAGVSVLLEILRVLKEDNIAHGPLEVVFTVGEETGLHGAKNLDYSRITAKSCFVFDGGNELEEVIVAAPSQKNLSVVVRGVASHAGVSPEKGVNAIVLASKAIAQMRLGRIDDETTANVGIIQGGRATNIVPDEVRVECEARSHSLDRLLAQVEHMRSTFEDVAASGGGKAEVTILDRYQSFRVEEDELPVRVASFAIQEMGLQPKLKAGGGGSDANIFNQHGIRSIIVIGAEQNPHSVNECVAIDDLVKAAELGIRLVRKFAEIAG